MKRLPVAVCAFVVAVLASASPVLLARQRAPLVANEPGMPTVARMYVMNRDPADAIPVVIHGGSDVQPVAVMSVPPVTLAPSASVGTRAIRQVWEYRRVSVPGTQDPTEALNGAGAEGWEAVSALTTAAGLQVLMKRPR
ncbi:MAG: hypothetical protein ABI634_10555 [Acidobacteriota bacterium]